MALPLTSIVPLRLVVDTHAHLSLGHLLCVLSKALEMAEMEVDHDEGNEEQKENELAEFESLYEHAKEVQTMDQAEALQAYRKIAFSGKYI